jgi:hypothetical protein
MFRIKNNWSGWRTKHKGNERFQLEAHNVVTCGRQVLLMKIISLLAETSAGSWLMNSVYAIRNVLQSVCADSACLRIREPKVCAFFGLFSAHEPGDLQ